MNTSSRRTGLRGDGVPYPHVRHGKDLRQNRQRLLDQYFADLAKERQTIAAKQ